MLQENDDETEIDSPDSNWDSRDETVNVNLPNKLFGSND